MKIVAMLLAAGGALVMAGCASQSASVMPTVAEATEADMPGQLEAVHAAAVAQNQAVFWVSSNGCTQKADLIPVVRRSDDGAVLTLRRTKQDQCRRPQPEGVEMRWSFEELGLEPGVRVSIENPYQLTATTTG